MAARGGSAALVSLGLRFVGKTLGEAEPADLGFGRIVVAEIEVPICVVNLV